jgi:ADP-heptose:LPS heptosyltransferase
MCGIVARELRKRGVRRVWLFTRYGDLFARNPDLVAVPSDPRVRRLCDLIGIRHVELVYPPPRRPHIIALMCASAGVRGEVELQPRIFLSEKEKQAGKLAPSGRQVAIQSSNFQAHWPVLNKQWPAERFQMVTDALKQDFNLIQLGTLSDPPLQGAVDLRGKTTPRQAAAILSSSHLFIGLVGGLMHMARAVECRSVIVYGGREHPSQSGYAANVNLNWEGACSPCWEENACDFDRVCMQSIIPEAVVAAARRQTELFGEPLPVDRLII